MEHQHQTLVKSGDEVVFKAGDNLTVKQDLSAGKQEYTYKLNKQLKDLTSAEFKTAAGDKTVINGDGLTINPVTPATAPISVTKDGISAGNKSYQKCSARSKSNRCSKCISIN